MILLILILWVIFGIVGYQLGKERTIGEGGGLVLGLLLGIFGIVIILCYPKVNIDWENNYNLDRQISESYEKINVEKQRKITAADELKKWYDLKVTGAISENEFEEKKKQLMNE